MRKKQLHKSVTQHSLWVDEVRPPHIAVLIDGENVSPKHIDRILAEASTLGPLMTVRVFGNWASPTLRGWERVHVSHKLEKRHHQLDVSGKNGTDIALTVDALDLLHEHHVDVFCLAASDSDYTPLILRLRGAGCTILGLGKETALAALQEACHFFIPLDNVVPLATSSLKSKGVLSPADVSDNQAIVSLETMVLTSYDQLTDKHAWVPIPDLEKHLMLLYPKFVLGQYRHRSFYQLVKARFSHLFDLRPCPSKQHIQEMRCKQG